MKRVVGVLLGLLITIGFTQPASAASGRQSFQLIFWGDQSTVVAVGPITGVGTVVDREGGDDTSFLVDLVFPGGAVHLTVHTVEETFDYDPVACLGRVRLSEAYEITGGSGRYQGASGSGTLIGHGTLIFARDSQGRCLGPESGVDPAHAFSVLSGKGQVSIPSGAAP